MTINADTSDAPRLGLPHHVAYGEACQRGKEGVSSDVERIPDRMLAMRNSSARIPVRGALIGCALTLGFCALAPAARAQTGQQFFESKVRPILVNRCGQCHGERKQRAGLQLTTRAGALKGGDGGPVLVPGDAARSRLIRAVRRDGELKMPPGDDDKLSGAEVEVLARWVAQGAPWPEDGPSATGAADPTKHWAFQPVRRPEPPPVKDT